ncbi:hypothetical protein D3C71_1048980 [compost metagenome]
MGAGGAIACEPVDETRCPDVEIVRPAVMQQVPNHLGLGILGGPQHRPDTRPVIAARLFDQVPSKSVTHRADTEAGKLSIILCGMGVVADGRDHVEASALGPILPWPEAMARTFEPALKK